MKNKLARTGVPLGIRPDMQYAESAEIPLAAGDLILLVTDGIEETMSADNTLFGPERVLDVVRQNRDKPAAEIVAALHRSAREFSGHTPQIDDITAIVVRVQ